MSEFVLSGLVVGVLCMIFVTPYYMAKGIVWIGDDEFPIGKRIICMIPIVNLIYAEIKYYGRIGITTISDITLIIGVAFRVIAWRYMYSNVTIGTISIFVFWGVFAFYFIANMLFVWTVLKDADACVASKRFFYSLLYPLGQIFIGTNMVKLIRNRDKEVGTFSV